MSNFQYPLLPPELLQYTLLHEASLSDRTDIHVDSSSSSLLRFLSKPGHHHGEGYRRIFIGHHPDDDFESVIDPVTHNPADLGHTDDGGENRSFLVGVQTLWELDRREGRKLNKGKGRERSRSCSPARRPIPNGDAAIQRQGATTGHVHNRTRSTTASTGVATISGDSGSSSSLSNRDIDTSRHGGQHSSPPTSISKHRLRDFTWLKRNRAHSTTSERPERTGDASLAGSNTSTSADGLLKKLNSKDARKKLSSGVSETSRPASERFEQEEVQDSLSIPQDVLSRRAMHSPAIMDEASSRAVFFDAQSFIDNDGNRSTSKQVSDDVKARVRQTLAPENEPTSEARHELLRRTSDTLVPETASDTYVFTSFGKHVSHFDDANETEVPQRPSAARFKSTKSVRWDTSHGQKVVPASKGRAHRAFASGSGDLPATSPSEVLSRPEPLEQPAEQVPDNIPPLPQLERSSTSASARELIRLAELKEASLPPGVEKLERMLVRACWTKQTNFNQDFDELTARKSALDWTPWEEMAVLWKRNHLEIYGTHRDPYHRFLTRQLALRYIIPLRNSLKTQLSVYSATDQIFCLRCPPFPLGGRHRTGKAGMRNKRHVNSEGTNLFLFRARATSIAQDWYLGLHLALQKERLENIEVYLSGLGLRIRLPTNAAAHDTAAASATIASTRNLMTAGLPDRNLVSKEEMLQSCKDLISNRHDWKELLEYIESKGVTLKMAWRKGLTLEWMSIDNSVDGVKRIWDVYTGAIMKQASEPISRLEVLPEMHYPTFVNMSPGVHLIEPPGIEGYISRLRHRNENQRERLYIGTVNGSLVIFKASRAKPPPFPSTSRFYENENDQEDNEAFEEIRSKTAKKAQPQAVQEFFKSENMRLKDMIVRCKGIIRLRDVISVDLDDSCQHCRATSTTPDKKLEATGKTGGHDHVIVQLTLGDDRLFRFETTPKEAAREWVGRLNGLVEYWTKRERADAQVQLALSPYNCVKQSSKTAIEDMHPFQQREIEDASTGTDVYEPLLSTAFHYCIQDGCRCNILMSGRLYYKKGHRDAIFMDRFIVLLDNNLIIFETYRRNIQKRPVPLVYHRRLSTLRLRDVYIVTGESCSQYFRKTGQSNFNPSQDQSDRARVYKDGLLAVDDPMDCTFMLWRQRTSGTLSKLGRNGKAHLFRARSKLERDQWVQAFNVMCEAYGRTTREREVRLATFSQIK